MNPSWRFYHCNGDSSLSLSRELSEHQLLNFLVMRFWIFPWCTLRMGCGRSQLVRVACSRNPVPIPRPNATNLDFLWKVPIATADSLFIHPGSFRSLKQNPSPLFLPKAAVLFAANVLVINALSSLTRNGRFVKVFLYATRGCPYVAWCRHSLLNFRHTFFCAKA